MFAKIVIAGKMCNTLKAESEIGLNISDVQRTFQRHS